MEADALIERRRLRRKVGFWRIATLFVALLAIGATIYWMSPDPTAADHVARISVSGLIQDDEKLVDLIDEVGQTTAVKALVVSINTPGGTTYGGEAIHKALLRVGEKKPVVADVRTLAASAGYMIAASTDHIVAGESSIVGSIGVIFQYPQVSELMDKIGVEMRAIKSRPLKAEPSPFHRASPEAEAMIRSMVLDSYDWFVDLVAERREMERDRALALADGSIFTGRQAVENGLIDAVGGEAEIRAYLSERRVPADLQINEWKPRRDGSVFLPNLSSLLYERLLGAPSGLGEELRRLGGGKLFLDGLVSLWQAGPQNSVDETRGYE